MMTEITNIKVKVDIETKIKYYVIYFDWFGEERFTYLTKKSLEYWKNVRGVTKINKGDSLNVFMLKDKIHFKIVAIAGL